MVVLAAVFLALVSIGIVVYPFFRGREVQQKTADVGLNDNMEETLAQRAVAGSVVAEAEFDFEMGNLSEEEYRGIIGRYRKKSESPVRYMGKRSRISREPVKGSHGVDDEIEQQIQDIRQTGAKQDGPKQEDQKNKFCPQCGANQNSSAKFCSRCGARQPKGENE